MTLESDHSSLVDSTSLSENFEESSVDTSWINGNGPNSLRNLEQRWQIEGFPARRRAPEYTGSGVFDIYVEPGLRSAIQSSLETYVTDLTHEGYQVTVREFSGTAAQLRNQLRSRWQHNDLEGALFVGDLPYVELTTLDSFSETPVEVTYPHDLYFMDLDGSYQLRSLAPDQHTDGSGDVGPEIYVSRITTGNLSGVTGTDEVTAIEDYFTRNHAYRTGQLTFENRGVVFADDDWRGSGAAEMQDLYSQVLAINDLADTNKATYLNTLGLNYESILELIHSSPTAHALKVDDTWEWISNTEIAQTNPRAGFYNLFNCSSALFTESDNLIGTYVYSGDFGLNAVGSTKTGSMLGFPDYYRPQGEGDSVGQAFMQWFDQYARGTNTTTEDWMVDWFYGMTMQGDPTLKPASMGDVVNEISEPNDTLVEAIDSHLSPTHPGIFSSSSTIGNNPNVAPTSDVDLIRVDTNGGDRIIVDIDAAESNSSLDSVLRLFNAAGQEIAISDDDPAPGELWSYDSYIDFSVRTDSTYYIGVSGYNNVYYAPTLAGSGSGFRTGEYDITIELRPGGEPNDTFIEAIDSGLSTYESGHFIFNGEIGDNPAVLPTSDVDLVRVEASAGDRLVLDTGVNGDFNSVLRLFDDRGNPLAFSDDDPDPGDSEGEIIRDSYIDFFVPADGTYYVGISGYRNFDYDPTLEGSGSGDSTGGYGFGLTHIPSSLDEFNESNNILTEAIDTGLTDPGSFYGLSVLGNNPDITPKLDVDLFKFQLDAGQSITIDTDAEQIGSEADTILRLFDDLGNELASSDDTPAPNEEWSYDSYLRFTATESGTYYAGISSYDNTGYDPIDGTPGNVHDSPYYDGMGKYSIDIVISSNDRSIFGTYNAETLTGTTGQDAIYGYEGADELYGRGDRDLLYGGDFNDKLYGGSGADTLYGAGDDDILLGQNGDDELYGARGNDALRGNVGNDRLFGLEGADQLYGGQGNDDLNGGSGNDTLIGVDADASAPGRGEWDILTGGTEADQFVLGNASRVYYNDGILANAGTEDYAQITDFRIAELDTIQLHGVPRNYILSISGTDTQIYLDTSGQDELIGTIVGVTGLNLNSSSFSFV